MGPQATRDRLLSSIAAQCQHVLLLCPYTLCVCCPVPGGRPGSHHAPAASARIEEDEYVDKHKNYCWVDCSSKSHAVVTRTLDGNVQHIEGGAIHLETHSASEGRGHPVAWISGDAVVLAATAAGCVDAFPWGGEDHVPGKTA